jgi:pimeloyl-ACP methyl ester carboxylesterase
VFPPAWLGFLDWEGGKAVAVDPWSEQRQCATVADQLQLSYVDLRPPADSDWAHPMIFLHGAAGHLGQWSPQLEFFRQRTRVVALDFRGHGGSSKPDWPAYNAEEFATDLELLLDHLGVSQPVVLVGHSYGGAAATLFALRHPSRVRGMVLLATTGRLPMRMSVRWLLRLPQMLLNPIQRRFAHKVGAPASVLKKLVPNVDAWNGWDYYPQIKAPTLVMCGELDMLTRPKRVREMAESIPGAHYEGISFSAHLPQLERPRRVNEAIANFVRQLQPQGVTSTFQLI